MDSSGSVCDNSPSRRCCPTSCTGWDFVTEFLVNVVEELVIGPDDTHIALIRFSSDTRVILDLERLVTLDLDMLVKLDLERLVKLVSKL